MSAENMVFLFSEGEVEIRTYACTMLKKLFRPPTIGYLSVTNKRIVYHCEGKSMSGSSTLLAEMPLEDAAGITSMVGISINWLTLVLFIGFLYVATPVVVRLLPTWMTGWFMTFFLMVPYAISWLFKKNILNQDLQTEFYNNIGAERFQKLNISFTKIFRFLFFIGTVLLAWNLIYTTKLGASIGVLSTVLMLAAYYFIYTMLFGRQRSFTLMISSKTGQSAGIFIPGDTFSLIWGRNNTAVQSLNAGPAGDAETIVRELGALLTDIRLLGDMGIQKWQVRR